METKHFDINKFPKDTGLLYFGISMSRIGNSQSAQSCYDHMNYLASKIDKTEGIGLTFLYSDYLYFLSEEPAKELRSRAKEQMMSHKLNFLDIVLRNNTYTKKAFSFLTFGQSILDNAKVYQSAYEKVRSLYETDEKFKSLVISDTKDGVESDEGIRFILEEITYFYLANFGQLKITNTFTAGEEKWILQCYPGDPLKSEIYLLKLNPCKFKSDNIYKLGMYNLEKNIFMDYSKID